MVEAVDPRVEVVEPSEPVLAAAFFAIETAVEGLVESVKAREAESSLDFLLGFFGIAPVDLDSEISKNHLG